MRNRDILGRNTKFGAAPSRKAQAALALAVSLWIATGGVASAVTQTEIYLDANGNAAKFNYDDADAGAWGTATASDGGKTLNIGGTWSQPTHNDNNGYSIFANQYESRSGCTLNVNGATFNAMTTLNLYGAYKRNIVSDNAVVITNSKFLGAVSIYGSCVRNLGSINASDHTVTVAGELDDDGQPLTSFSGNAYIYAAGSNMMYNTIRNNAINLYGAAAMENVTLSGYSANNYDSTISGNELHLGGTKSGATVNGIALSPWQGYALNSTTVNNTVKTVQNFDKIVLHQVKWDTSTPALKATNGITFNGTPALDISGMTFANDTTAGTMALLEGAGGNFNTLNLTYSGGTAALNNENQSQLVKTETGQTSTENGVTLGYDATHTVSIADTSKVTYTIGNAVNKISFGAMAWNTARDGSDAAYSYANVTNADIDTTNLKFTNPEDVTGTATLLQANSTLTATLAGVAKDISYSYAPVAGVTVSGTVNGTLATSGSNIQYTATANKASKLTFGSVAWTGGDETTPGTPLMTRPANISFAGANVDTSNINFTNIAELDANKEMTLVSGFDSNGSETFTGTTYKVGSTLQGEGKASLTGDGDLIFTTDTRAEKMTAQEQTHNTVMGAEVGMAALSVGNDFIGAATEGLSLASNIGADGVSSFAKMGGGAMRQETGSHIDVRTWNAILALGHQNKKERGTFEYGAFFEYGSGNYTTHNGDERGDGSAHYTGGGLLAKWTARHGLYVEGSLRAGTVHDDARNVLRDANGAPYSYETDAPYMGFHLGVGKEIPLKNGDAVDVYGKYFYNRRNSTDFNAGGHYSLDAVTSQVLRVGARYTVNRDKWKFYAGAAYEHELDGKANGTADGVAIRGADTSGGSFRGELGATVTPDKNVPLTLDFNVSGFAGKKRGVTGGVSVSLMF